MSYSIIAAILLAVVALSSSVSNPNTERTVLARFYSDFTQLYRPVTIQPSVSNYDQEQSIKRYQFFFTAKEYSQISQDSLTMLNTNIIERLITYHPMPEFETIGSRYFYRRNSKESEPIEIELVNAKDHIFREVQQPHHYLFLPSFNDLEYPNRAPVMPYYEVTFVCNSTLTKDAETYEPILSYLVNSIDWVPRYLVNLPMFGTNGRSHISAYADIHNYDDETLVVKGAELIADDLKVIDKPTAFLRAGIYQIGSDPNALLLRNTKLSASPSDKQSNGTYLYRLDMPTDLMLTPRSTTSIKFFESNVTVESFLYYSTKFSVMDSNGKLFKAYNITSLKTYIPNGHITLQEKGQYIGEIDQPDMNIRDTNVVVFGYDADIIYHRHVEILESDDNFNSLSYRVEYVFENYKSLRDVRLYFVESFRYYKYVEVNDISISDEDKNSEGLIFDGTVLRGFITIPRQYKQKTLSYNIVMYKFKPRETVERQ